MAEENNVADELFMEPNADNFKELTQDAQTRPEETLSVVDEIQEETGADGTHADNAETSEEAVTEAVEATEPTKEQGSSSKKRKKAQQEIVTEAEVRAKLKNLPGKWYVLHTYSGYEKRVKQDLEIRMASMNMEDYIFQMEVPMEEVFEIRRGQRKLVSRVRMPGYVLIRMDLNDDSWRVVQSTNGVTGFVGNGRTPVALNFNEVVSMLTPVVEQQAAEEAREAGLPAGKGPKVEVPFEIGDPVTLAAEPWAGMPATVSAIDAVNQKLTVMMTLVGQETPVELDFHQVIKED